MVQQTRAFVKSEVLFIKSLGMEKKKKKQIVNFPTVMGDWANLLHTRNALSTRTHDHKNNFLKKKQKKLTIFFCFYFTTPSTCIRKLKNSI